MEYMSSQNPPLHPGSSTRPTDLFDLIRDFYTDQLSRMATKKLGIFGLGESLPEWLVASIRMGDLPTLLPKHGASEPKDPAKIRLCPYARPAGYRVAEAASRLMRDLSDDPTSCDTSMGKMHLSFEGLPSDQRYGWEREARRHFQEITSLWPYWLHFLEPTCKNYMYLTSLLCEPLAHRWASGKILVLLNRENFYAEIIRLVMASLTLQEIWQIPIHKRRVHSLRVLEVLRECLVPA